MSSPPNYWNVVHERFRAKAARASAEYDRRKQRGEKIGQAAIAKKHGITLESLRKYRWRLNRQRNQAEMGATDETSSQGAILHAPADRAVSD